MKALLTENSRVRGIRADNAFWEKCKEAVRVSREYHSVNELVIKATEKEIVIIEEQERKYGGEE